MKLLELHVGQSTVFGLALVVALFFVCDLLRAAKYRRANPRTRKHMKCTMLPYRVWQGSYLVALVAGGVYVGLATLVVYLSYMAGQGIGYGQGLDDSETQGPEIAEAVKRDLAAQWPQIVVREAHRQARDN